VTSRERSDLAGVLSVGEAGIPPSSEGDRANRRERSELAGVLSVGEAGIPPSSEGDKANKDYL